MGVKKKVVVFKGTTKTVTIPASTAKGYWQPFYPCPLHQDAPHGNCSICCNEAVSAVYQEYAQKDADLPTIVSKSPPST